MLTAVLLILILLWFLGYGPLQVFAINVFELNGRVISLWDLLIFFIIVSLVGILPSPFRQIAVVAVILYLLSLFGVVAIAGFSSLVILAVIGGLILYIFRMG